MKSKLTRGMTMIELVVSVCIVGIFLIIAVPSFQATLSTNRGDVYSSEFMNALTLARSEAIRRGVLVSVCASGNATQTACAASVAAASNWTNGWIIYTGTSNAITSILQTHGSLPTGITISPAATINITYRSTGAITTAAGNYVIKPTGCLGSKGGRQIAIATTGRPEVDVISCP